MSLPPEFSPTGPSSTPANESQVARRSELGQLDFDLEFFDLVLERQPLYVDVLRCQGQLLSRKGLHERALEIDRRLVTLRPQDAVARYNLGCSLALLGYSQDAIAALRQALERGYNDFQFLESDSDLDSLRDEPAYLELLRDFGLDG